MNKALRIILNILIVIAAIFLAGSILDFIFSVQYATREKEDPAETYKGVFEYMIDHRAYGETIDDDYSDRLDDLVAPAGYEDMYRVAEYAHTDFMTRVYDEKGDSRKAASYREKIKELRSGLGAYEHTADEIDGMIQKAP